MRKIIVYKRPTNLISELNNSLFLDLKVNRKIDWAKARKIEVKDE